MLRETARLKTEVTVSGVEWTPEEMQDALHGKKPLFASRFIQIPREEFLRVFAAIRAVADASVPSGDPCLNIPEPEAFFTQDTLDALAKYPDALWDRIEEAGMDLTLAELYFVPVTAFAMRVFLDDAATEASRAFDRMVPDTVHFKRSITCPVCGTRASMAAVGATQTEATSSACTVPAAVRIGSLNVSAVRCAATRPRPNCSTCISKVTTSTACMFARPVNRV